MVVTRLDTLEASGPVESSTSEAPLASNNGATTPKKRSWFFGDEEAADKSTEATTTPVATLPAPSTPDIIPVQYQIIAGERRWRASKLAGLSKVPVVVKEVTPLQMLELALIENIQRADLNPIEEALAYHALIQDFGLTQEMVAKQVGKDRSTITNSIRLLQLAPRVRDALVNQPDIFT
ncbi:MAG TPA: hypothetical protein DHW02_05660, partial [Ktedonobacter sp.]|nr:hypothetical protein [Ktedonobacter sp.]